MDKLREEALRAYYSSYSPYSHFPVGCAIELKNGQFINGTNIENASFGLSNCAERTALFNCYTQGFTKKDIKKIMIIANTKKPLSPCGACRQVINELTNEDTLIILSNLQEENLIVKTKDLLPFAFSGEDLL